MKKLFLISLTALLLASCSSGTNRTRVATGQSEAVDTVQTLQMKDILPTPKIQVVFLLDATGSMSGLIDAAKEKIWSIAGGLSQTEPAPEIKIGMIFYRDRGDDFITKHIPLGTPMDDLYEKLMAIRADGGGDTPESVNQALWEAVTQVDWDTTRTTYRTIFLVGDCPPHMDYQDDVKYPKSCEEANRRNITINTILMGNDSQARRIWQEIAKKTNGVFTETDMRVNNIDVATPYDVEISKLQRELDATRVYYSVESGKTALKKVQSEKIAAEGDAKNARRAEFNVSKAGKESYYGSYELINDIEKGKKITSINKKDLPEALQKLSDEDLQKYADNALAKRKEIEKKIADLSRKRQEYIDKTVKATMTEKEVSSSFDDVIFDAVKEQAADKEIKIEGKAKR